MARHNTIITDSYILTKTMEGSRWRDPRNGEGGVEGSDEVVRPSQATDVIWLAA